MSDQTQSILRKLVDREVGTCVSVLVSELMQKQEHFPDYSDELINLSRRSASVEDVLDDNGYVLVENSSAEAFLITHDEHKIYKSITHEDSGQLEQMQDEFLAEFGEYLDADEITNAEAVAYAIGVEACDSESEVYEHWIVSTWFGNELAKRGESVEELFGITIWGRCTTGQAIYMDGIIERIASDMEILPGQRHDWSTKP